MEQKLPTVRIAQPNEEAAILEMCKRLHVENGLFSLNEHKVINCIQNCFKKAGTIVAVVGDPDRLEGSICMSMSDNYYSDDWHLAELWNYVEPQFRSSRNAEALLEFAKACAEKIGLPLITGITTNKQMAGKVRLYRRLLGAPMGAFFIHNSKWKAGPLEDHGDLRRKLKELAKVCNDSPRKMTFDVVQKEIGPLLSRAAEAISIEDNIWGLPTKPNGSAVGIG